MGIAEIPYMMFSRSLPKSADFHTVFLSALPAIKIYKDLNRVISEATILDL
jgi:hypothetical protein